MGDEDVGPCRKDKAHTSDETESARHDMIERSRGKQASRSAHLHNQDLLLLGLLAEIDQKSLFHLRGKWCKIELKS